MSYFTFSDEFSGAIFYFLVCFNDSGLVKLYFLKIVSWNILDYHEVALKVIFAFIYHKSVFKHQSSA